MNYELQIINYKFNQEKFTSADKWILNKLNFLIKEVTVNLDKYQFSQAAELLRGFTRDDLADWYLEASKFETVDKELKGQILGYIIENLLKLLHPFIPFVTEVIWQETGKEKLLMVERWPTFALLGGATAGQPTKTPSFEIVKEIITAIRNARAENNIEPSKKVKAIIYAGTEQEFLKTQSKLIMSLKTGINELEILEKGEKIEEAIYVNINNIEIYLIGAADKEKEAKRIEEEIKNLENIIMRFKSLLESEDFVKHAPAPIIMKEQEKLRNAQIELEKLIRTAD